MDMDIINFLNKIAMEKTDLLLLAVIALMAAFVFIYLLLRRNLEMRRVFSEKIGLGDRNFSARVIEIEELDGCQRIWCRVKIHSCYVRFYFFTGDTMLPDSFELGQRLLVSALSYNPATQQADIITAVPCKA